MSFCRRQIPARLQCLGEGYPLCPIIVLELFYAAPIGMFKNKFWIFLTGMSLAVMVLGGVATLRYQAGVASNSVKYLAVAQIS